MSIATNTTPVPATHRSVSFENVLCATDFSDASTKALAYAAGIVRTCSGNLSIIHVLPPDAPPAIPLEPWPAELDRERTEAISKMEALGKAEFLTGLAHADIVERGPMREVIADVIGRKKIDLLVLGTHGRGGLNKFLLGSIAEELFRFATCPVLTVGKRVAQPPKSGIGIRTILFPTDFGDASIAALPYALELAAKKGRQLTLLHVITPKPVPPHPSWDGVVTLSEKRQIETLEATRRLRDLVPAGEADQPKVECMVLFGSAEQTILDAVTRCRPDLVVMGLRPLPEPRAAAHLYWSTAHYLVCRVLCPILTIRHEKSS